MKLPNRAPAIAFFLFFLILPLNGLAQQAPAAVKTAQDSGKAAVVPASMAKTPAAAADTLSVFQIADSLRYSRPNYEYSSGGKRDPFESLVPKTEVKENKIKRLFEYEDATILGVVDSDKNPYALVLDNTGYSFILHVNDKVQGGQVTRIGDGAVYLHIVQYARAMNIILRMESSRYTVIEEEGNVTDLKKPGINVLYLNEPTPADEVNPEEVTVPLGDIRTVEEEWYGTGGMHSNVRYSQQTGLENTILLMYPSPGSWIRLPYEMDWEAPENTGKVTIEIDDSPDFSSPILIIQNITAKPYKIDKDLKLPVNTALYWRATGVGENESRFGCEPENIQFFIVGQ
jgi:hypothetical protein